MPNLSKVNRTQPISCVPLHEVNIATRGTSASCIATVGALESKAAVRPSSSTAARTGAEDPPAP